MSRMNAAMVDTLLLVSELSYHIMLMADLQSKQCESEQRLVYPADHDPDIFIPVLNIAHIGQSSRHIPCQKAPAESP